MLETEEMHLENDSVALDALLAAPEDGVKMVFLGEFPAVKNQLSVVLEVI